VLGFNGTVGWDPVCVSWLPIDGIHVSFTGHRFWLSQVHEIAGSLQQVLSVIGSRNHRLSFRNERICLRCVICAVNSMNNVVDINTVT
jgi:hypothetical protein